MSLPNPIPDNPQRWDGWKSYSSTNPYERLCFSPDANPSDEQIEEHCRMLLVWWQKKLPLKNQPSNPLAQMLRGGMDEAPQMLAEARSILLDPVKRAPLDVKLRAELKRAALAELEKFFKFAIIDSQLSEEAEKSLQQTGSSLGLESEHIQTFIEEQLAATGFKRLVKPVEGAASAITAAASVGPFDEFRRVLRLSGLNEDDLTDDQRDALCNIGENLGLTGGQAEDLIDEYLESIGSAVSNTTASRTITAPAPKVTARAAGTAAPPTKPTVAAVENRESQFTITPLQRADERNRYPNFTNSLNQEMLLVTSGVFTMGSNTPGAAPNEQPLSRTLVNCFFMARHPVTNIQFEQFQPSHCSKRAPWSNDQHPVVYVNSLEAEKFCEWLSAREKKRYRLPTEAEWEYAARGTDNRNFPWGERLDSGLLANFADANTSFPWSLAAINDGFAQSSPVGNYPRGASPYGIEDMAGNVWEWCLDSFADYKGREQVNPRGPVNGQRRIHRGGSWKSRVASLRASARGWNAPNFSSNDVGFRIVCESE